MMPDTAHLLGFALICFGMVMTPGPNMIYLISRSIMQGRLAGLISLVGIAAGFLVYLTCAAFGITALAMAVPFAYDALRIAGALYLGYLAWQAVRPGGRSPFDVRPLPKDSPCRLLAMGFVTSLLNPKVAVLYMALLPQFIDPAQGVLRQSFMLGLTQIAVSITGNSVIIMLAGAIAGFLRGRPFWILVQRWIMGTVLAGFAVRLVTEAHR
jgi:threonine/homoserine/homoserine lactone efflux protein